MKILGTGLTGLVGSRVIELLGDSYEFENLSSSSGVDITDRESVFKKIEDSPAEILMHFAAKTNVDGCEEDKAEDIRVLGYEDAAEHDKEFKNKKTAWAVNVTGARNVVEACQRSNKKLIYISTDFVFNGDDTPEGGYDENSSPDPVNWYGQTKFETEKIIQGSGIDSIILRIAYPYRLNFTKSDFVRSLMDLLKEKKELKMVTDHIMCPVFIDDIAVSIDLLIKNNAVGVFHVVGSQALSPYQAALSIAEKFNFGKSLILQTTRDIFFHGKAKRPFDLSLKNDKIQKLGVKLKTFEEGLQEFKNQISI